jgi:purine-binding chemotaxis protein CheW
MSESMSLETVQRLLQERAEALARLPATEAETAGDDFIVLSLGEERYGVDIRHVQEIQPLRGLAVVPGVPAGWAGLVNLRGRLVPVLDLRRALNLSGTTPVIGRLVLVEAGGPGVALWVDDVPGVRRLSSEEIRPPLDEIGGRALITGVTADYLSILSIEALLSDPRLAVSES